MSDARVGADPWAGWLGAGRWQGASNARKQATQKSLQVARDEVLANAGLLAGQVVLDIGAGFGLMALAARSRVGPSGRVLALDVSPGALVECLHQGRRARKATAPLVPVVGDAVALPLQPATIDRVLTRSVLMHVPDKRAAIREIHRVLRSGGIASVFEAIAGVTRRHKIQETEDIARSLPDYPRIREYALRGMGASPQLGFDERDLVAWFGEAGFHRVSTTYRETHASGGEHTADTVLRLLRVQPSPDSISYEAAAIELLGSGASAYIDELVAWHIAHGRETHHGLLFLTATK